MKSILAFVAGIAAAYGIARVSGRRTGRTVQKLDIVDLNTCSKTALVLLGVSHDDAERIIEKRPYRNKIDLVSQFIIPEDTYVLIKHCVGTDDAQDGIRIAG